MDLFVAVFFFSWLLIPQNRSRIIKIILEGKYGFMEGLKNKGPGIEKPLNPRPIF